MSIDVSFENLQFNESFKRDKRYKNIFLKLPLKIVNQWPFSFNNKNNEDLTTELWFERLSSGRDGVAYVDGKARNVVMKITKNRQMAYEEERCLKKLPKNIGPRFYGRYKHIIFEEYFPTSLSITIFLEFICFLNRFHDHYRANNIMEDSLIRIFDATYEVGITNNDDNFHNFLILHDYSIRIIDFSDCKDIISKEVYGMLIFSMIVKREFYIIFPKTTIHLIERYITNSIEHDNLKFIYNESKESLQKRFPYSMPFQHNEKTRKI